MTITIKTLFKTLYGLYKSGIPAAIYSEPGIGKTETIRMMGKILNKPVETLVASMMDPLTIGGTPFYNPEKKAMDLWVPTFAENLQKNPGGILFVDEITTARATEQAMLLTLIQNCTTGRYSIPESTFRVCAGNWTDVAGTHEMSSAFANRLCNLFLEADPDAWVEGRACGWTNYEFPTVIDDDNKLTSNLIKYGRYVDEFVLAHRDYFHRKTEDVIKPEDVAWPSGRTWELVIKALAYLEGNEDSYLRVIINGLIGDAAGDLFWKFMKKENKKIFNVDLVQYVGKEDKFTLPDPKAHDQVHHIKNQVVYLLSKDPAKYRELFIRVTNLLHEAGYDGELIQPLSNIPSLMLVKCKDNAEASKIVVELSKKIKDWNELHVAVCA